MAKFVPAVDGMNEIAPDQIEIAKSFSAWQKIEIGTNIVQDGVVQGGRTPQQLLETWPLGVCQTARHIRARSIDQKHGRAITRNEPGQVCGKRRLSLGGGAGRHADDVGDPRRPLEHRRAHPAQYRPPQYGFQFNVVVRLRGQRRLRVDPRHVTETLDRRHGGNLFCGAQASIVRSQDEAASCSQSTTQHDPEQHGKCSRH